MKIYLKLITILLIFNFIELWACTQSSNQDLENKIENKGEEKKKIKKKTTSINLPSINFDSLKSKFKYQNLVDFKISYEASKGLERIDSLTFIKLQLDKIFRNYQVYENERYCEHCIYYYSFQRKTKNYYSIIILAKSFEYADLLYWINYSKDGKLVAYTNIALYRMEGNMEDIQISKLLSESKIYKLFTQTSIYPSKEMFNKVEEISKLEEFGSIKDTIIYQSEIR
jgi:hypothetical protein